MKIVVDRRLGLALLLAACASACRAPKDWAEPREPQSGDITIGVQQDPNDARETNWDIQIFP